MKLDADFYRNLLNSLSKHARPRLQPTGWGNSKELLSLMKQLMEDSSARHVFVVERTGKQSASYGDLGHIDITDFTALVVAKLLSSEALSELVDESRFSTASIEGKRWGAFFASVNPAAVLIVVFDHQTNVDRVATRVRRILPELKSALANLQKM